MASRHLSRGLKRKALTVALGLCFAGGVQAQSTVGTINGHAVSGDTVTITNPATGLTRTITVAGDGSYRFAALPIGQYVVTRKGADGTTSTREARVNVGTAANIDFVTSGGDRTAATLDTITVVGSGVVNPIDVSSVESNTILTAQQIAKIPVPRDATSVALLAPGTVRGDAAFGNLASFGGASVAENQYYINGFNITNSFRGLNFASVPFEAIAEQQIKTGGYGAEFGRALGGVVNQITKRGTNEFHAGANVFYTPKSLSSDNRDVYLANGNLRSDNSKDNEDELVTAAWASGALIKDRLFAYGLVSYGSKQQETYGSIASVSNTSLDRSQPNWLLKMDWNISDNHQLEFTAFSDKQKDETDVYVNAPGSLERGDLIGTNFTEQGGENYILKYTGYFTDNFSVSALYGHGEFSRSQRLRTAGGIDVQYDGDLANPASGCPNIVDARPEYRRTLTGVYGSNCNITGDTIDRTDSGDTRDQFRIDAEWQLGDHLVKFGYDVDNYESVAGVSEEGGRIWRYSTSNGADGVPNTADDFDLVREQIFNQGATVKVEQDAYYIQDNWSVTDNFIAYLGLRWDNFRNINGQGQAYVEIKNQFAPRLGFSWDVFGDSTFKVYGSAGRYALPLTPSVAVRGASASIFSRETFNFLSVDPDTGAPIGLTSTGNFRYLNGEDGNGKDPLTIASKNLEPQYQDEYILGLQKALNDNFSVGVRGIFRELKTAIDDNCDYTAVLDANGFTYSPGVGFVNAEGGVAALPSSGFPYCRIFNPGEDAVFVTDLLGDGNYTTNTIPGARLSPPAKRTYSALEFFFDGNWDKFFMQGSYTYSKSKGNTEGGVKSDIGQADTNVTQDFDYIELTVDTFGYLPNDRRHTLKVFGNYEITPEWSVGANVLVQSGRPLNCFGVLDRDPNRAPGAPPIPDTYDPHPYGASFARCNNLPVPRGTAGRLPWTSRLDLNVAYRPAFVEGLQFKVDVFNVFDSQEVTSVSEIAEASDTGAALETYLQPTSFQAPRTVRFLVQYDF
jgi:TonB-dependent receptor-like protein/carboxypeptidase family protein